MRSSAHVAGARLPYRTDRDGADVPRRVDVGNQEKRNASVTAGPMPRGVAPPIVVGIGAGWFGSPMPLMERSTATHGPAPERKSSRHDAHDAFSDRHARKGSEGTMDATGGRVRRDHRAP